MEIHYFMELFQKSPNFKCTQVLFPNKIFRERVLHTSETMETAEMPGVRS